MVIEEAMTLIAILMYGLIGICIAALFVIGFKKFDNDLVLLGAKGLFMLVSVVVLLYILKILQG